MCHLPSVVILTEASQLDSKNALEKSYMDFRKSAYHDFTGACRIEFFKTDEN